MPIPTERVVSLRAIDPGLFPPGFGTSAPELAVSLAAAWNGNAELAMGNVVGSNIFNILCVLGASAMLSPNSLPVSDTAMSFDLPIMVAVSLLCVPVFLTSSKISRLEGLLFLGLYGGYTFLLVASSSGAGPSRLNMLTGFLIAIGAVLAWEYFSHRRSLKP
jgi:cation:H+ antiporter